MGDRTRPTIALALHHVCLYAPAAYEHLYLARQTLCRSHRGSRLSPTFSNRT
jgi:hypothetical protein